MKSYMSPPIAHIKKKKNFFPIIQRNALVFCNNIFVVVFFTIVYFPVAVVVVFCRLLVINTYGSCLCVGGGSRSKRQFE